MRKESLKLIGKLGEKIAEKFFLRKGFKILEKNYRKRFFEIDLIVKRKNKIHFVEVKTVVWPAKVLAEEHFNFQKLRKIKKGVLFYLKEKRIDVESFELQIDLLAIEIFPHLKKAKIRWHQNIF